ncbi:sigma-70 family RNA polymerase sigma factor [Clostridiaceae bacterium M8S5]|nr:sigma-70 family RNA polymerase sigma factor [Clostridiaceae bacterium M8S5]
MIETIKLNQKIIYKVIKNLNYIPNNIEFEELEQVGKIALWKAIKSYKENKNYSLSTHCYRIIYSDIIDYLRKENKKIDYTLISLKNEDSKYLVDEIVNGDMLILEMSKYISKQNVDILVDKYIYKLTYEEIATKNNVCKKTIYRRIKKSKKILKEKLKWH